MGLLTNETNNYERTIFILDRQPFTVMYLEVLWLTVSQFSVLHLVLLDTVNYSYILV